MFSIGRLSELTKVKIPTIRYYEEIGLLPEPERSVANQRRYDKGSAERLSFIKHARELGFAIPAIEALLELQDKPERSCREASVIAEERLLEVRAKLHKLKALEKELAGLSTSCDGEQNVGTCALLATLADHSFTSSG